MNKVSQIQAVFMCILVGLSFGCLSFSNQTDQKAKPRTESEASKTDLENPSTEEDKSTSDETADTAGICSNEYYPINTDNPRKYKVTGSSSNSYTLTQKKVGENAFSETRAFGSNTNISSSWACTGEGIRNAEFNNRGEFSQGNFKMETIESSGITFPKEWELGKKWSSNYKVKANIKAGPVSGSGGGTVKIDSEIVAMDESVEVPGGSYKTAKVSSVLVMNITAQGMKIPARKINMTIWLAPKVGIVKQTVKGSFGNETVEYNGN